MSLKLIADVTIEPHARIPTLKIITVKGSIDGITYEQVEEKILPIIEQEAPNVILDLTQVDYLNSMGVMTIIKFHLLLTDKNRSFKIIKPPKFVYGILHVAGLTHHFDMYDSMEAAMSTLK
jgi:anti-sigma B factor antagonist